MKEVRIGTERDGCDKEGKREIRNDEGIERGGEKKGKAKGEGILSKNRD